MMRRCEACGGFFDAEDCPHDHSHIEGYQPPPPSPLPYVAPLIGTVVIYDWPDGTKVPCLVASTPDEDGSVALMILSGNLRVPLDDLFTPTGES